MRYHRLEIWPEHFQPVVDELKTCELRKADRDYRVGDYLLLEEHNPFVEVGEPSATGRACIAIISHIDRETGLLPGWVALSIDVLPISLAGLRATAQEVPPPPQRAVKGRMNGR